LRFPTQTAPPLTPIESPPASLIALSEFSMHHLLNTPKSTPPPLTSPPPAPSQPSKHSSPLAINLEPFELAIFTPPTSPYPFFESLEDLREGKAEALVVLAIREGKIPQGAKGKDKGKNKLAYAPMPKIPPPPKREHPEKDSVCHYCKEVGHWKRNCPSYQAELKKRKSASIASISGLRESRKLKHRALSLYMGNGMRAAIEAIGSFDLILPSLAKQPPPIPEVMKPLLPPLPPHLSPSHLMSTNNPFPILTYEMFCDHCQRTQVLVNDLRDEIRFILNHILEHLTTLTHQNLPLDLLAYEN
ncbi:zinc finger, CCHC-type containing protein, partial [Tanacetum coccineum]